MSGETIESMLQKWLRNGKRLIVVGIGNELRRDDFVGIKIVRSIRKIASEWVMLIECETVPEGFIDTITKFNPTHILIIDAGLLDLAPSSVEFFESSEALGPITTAISTHALPLRLFCEYLQRTINTKIAFIIVQPRRTDFGEGLSKEVGEVSETIENTLRKVLSAF